MHEQTIYAVIFMVLIWLADAIGFRKAYRKKRAEDKKTIEEYHDLAQGAIKERDAYAVKVREYTLLLKTTGQELTKVQKTSNEQRVLIEQLRTIPHIQKAHLLDDGTALFIDYSIDDKTFTSLVALSDNPRSDGTTFTKDALKELCSSINERCSTMVGPVD